MYWREPSPVKRNSRRRPISRDECQPRLARAGGIVSPVHNAVCDAETVGCEVHMRSQRAVTIKITMMMASNNLTVVPRVIARIPLRCDPLLSPTLGPPYLCTGGIENRIFACAKILQGRHHQDSWLYSYAEEFLSIWINATPCAYSAEAATRQSEVQRLASTTGGRLAHDARGRSGRRSQRSPPPRKSCAGSSRRSRSWSSDVRHPA